MRKLRQNVTPNPPSPEVFSVMQLWTINEPLLPNLKTLFLFGRSFTPFIPLFLSPRITSISLGFGFDLPKTMIASTVTVLQILCPDLQKIDFYCLPRDLMITAAISGMLLVTNRNNLQSLHVDSPLTEKASEVIYKLPNLCYLSVVIERETSLPSASLPNLIQLTIKCDNEDSWPRLFHGATLRKLESVTIYPQSEQLGDLLGAFERAALSSSVQNTLSRLCLFASCSWNPVYSSLLPFTQLVDLDIRFSCHRGCSSRVDDDIVIDLSRAMPKLKYFRLGNAPCRQTTTGVTAKGLLALAHHCPSISALRVHFQLASLSAPLASPGMTSNAEFTTLWTDCALTDIEVGEMPVPEGSASAIALSLLRIFPRLRSIKFIDEGWEEVRIAISLSK